jgi:hypothetical protein
LAASLLHWCHRRVERCRGLPISGSENGGQYRSFLRHLAASFGNQNTSECDGLDARLAVWGRESAEW